MMRSTRVHSVFAHRYAGFDQPYHFRQHPRIAPFEPRRNDVTMFHAVEESFTEILHASVSEARKSMDTFKLVNEDYSNVEYFLRKAFRKKQSLYASDVADALGMDYGEVREILARMIREGKLGVK